MKKCLFTYKSGNYDYPIDLIFKNFNCKKFLFTEKDTGIEIKKPGDIATVQNWCIEWLIENTDYDIFIHPQADIYLPEKEAQKLNLTKFYKSKSYKLLIDRIRLYYKCAGMDFGFQIIGRDCPHRYIGDGAYLLNHGSTETQLIENIKAVDVGYFGLENYRNHARNHTPIWAGTMCDFSFYDKELQDFILSVRNKAQRFEGYKGEITDPTDYTEVFEYFNLWTEFDQIKKYF